MSQGAATYFLVEGGGEIEVKRGQYISFQGLL